MDHFELMQMLLAHPEADVRVDLGRVMLDVQDVRYSAEREAVVLLLHPDDLNDFVRSRQTGEDPSEGSSPADADAPGQALGRRQSR